jgi:peptidoglycan/LPS O-acetylase OafA/YrhL
VWGFALLVLASLSHIFQGVFVSSSLIPEAFEDIRFNSHLFFSFMLLGLLSLSYFKRRKRVRVVFGLSLVLLSYICWFSNQPELWSAYNVSPNEQRFLAIVLWGIALWVLVRKSSKEKRRYFTKVVRSETIQNQKGRCNNCKRKLVAYDVDFDHKNGDRSNNKLSNCQVLCVPCHRRKHA